MSRCLSAPDATSLHLHSLAQPDPFLNRYAETGLAERDYMGIAKFTRSEVVWLRETNLKYVHVIL